MSELTGNDKILNSKEELVEFLKELNDKYHTCNKDKECITKLIGELIGKHTKTLNVVNKALYEDHSKSDFFKDKNLREDYLNTVEDFITTSLIIVENINRLIDSDSLGSDLKIYPKYNDIQTFINTFADKVTRDNLEQEFISHGISTKGFQRKTAPPMNKSTERKVVFGFGVLFISIILVIALAVPEPKPFQWNVFKTVISLAGAGIAAFIPGFIDVEVKNYIRAGGALAVFVILFFENPAKLVVNYNDVQKKYNLLSFNLGDHITSHDLALHRIDSAANPEYYKTAMLDLGNVQNEAEQLGIKINLENLFKVTNSKYNLFPQSKYDVVTEAINETYSKSTASYCKTGIYLSWMFLECSFANDTAAIKHHPDELQAFIQTYPKISSDLNSDLKNLGYSERMPEVYTNPADIEGKALDVKAVILNNIGKE